MCVCFARRRSPLGVSECAPVQTRGVEVHAHEPIPRARSRRQAAPARPGSVRRRGRDAGTQHQRKQNRGRTRQTQIWARRTFADADPHRAARHLAHTPLSLPPAPHVSACEAPRELKTGLCPQMISSAARVVSLSSRARALSDVSLPFVSFYVYDPLAYGFHSHYQPRARAPHHQSHGVIHRFFGVRAAPPPGSFSLKECTSSGTCYRICPVRAQNSLISIPYRRRNFVD